MKRVLLLLTAALLVFCLPLSAASTAQVLEIRNEDGRVSMVATQPVTFWESPSLRPGEAVTVAGTLTLTNTTDTACVLSFRSVEFPYGDTAALEYLNHLHITVKRGDIVLYEGPYSEINNENALTMNLSLAANSSATYTIDMYCDHTYTGTSLVNGTVLEWNFNRTDVATDTVPEAPEETFSDPLLQQWLIAGIVTALLLLVLLLIRKQRQR